MSSSTRKLLSYPHNECLKQTTSAYAGVKNLYFEFQLHESAKSCVSMFQRDYLLDASETSSPHPVLELDSLRLTILETFRNQQSDSQAHFTQRLARCAEVKREGRIWTSPSSLLLSFFTQVLPSLLSCTNKCNSMNSFKERLSESMPWHYHLYDYCVSPLSVCLFRTTINIFSSDMAVFFLSTPQTWLSCTTTHNGCNE